VQTIKISANLPSAVSSVHVLIFSSKCRLDGHTVCWHWANVVF